MGLVKQLRCLFRCRLLPETGAQAIDLRTPEDNNGLEPSLLIYQSDLCSAMLDELEACFSGAVAETTYDNVVSFSS